MTSVVVVIEGLDLPGRSFGPDTDGRVYENVHVGLWHRGGPVDLVPGDLPTACWKLELTLRRSQGEIDFSGPFVSGRKGERSLRLVWGDLGEDDSFEMFRAAKLRLADLDPTVVAYAHEHGHSLVCRLGLTDEHGHPRCASVRPPTLIWTATPP